MTFSLIDTKYRYLCLNFAKYKLDELTSGIFKILKAICHKDERFRRFMNEVIFKTLSKIFYIYDQQEIIYK